MSVLATAAKLLSPVTQIVGELFLGSEEKAKIEAALGKTQREMSDKMLAYEQAVLQYKAEMVKAQQSIIVDETQSKSWLTASWRPITMLVFLLLIMVDSIGLTAKPLDPAVWLIMKMAIPGYIGSRGLEKAVQVMKNGKKNG